MLFNTNVKKRVEIFFYGCFMGISDILPGISGATIALILGIYEKLIHSISYFFSNIKKPLKLLKSEELKFLINLYLGVLIALFSFMFLMDWLLSNYLPKIFSFFIGLIIASIFVLVKKNKEKMVPNWHFILLGFIIGALLLSFKSITSSHSLPIIFISGMVAISAMLLPGISGAYILLIMNQYSYIIKEISNFNLQVIFIFVSGIILGLFAMSKFLNKLLKKYYPETFAFLIGLMIGGLRVPITQIDNIVSLLLFGTLGVLFVVLINSISKN